MLLQKLINLKVGSKLRYKDLPCSVKWRDYTMEEVGRFKDKDGKENVLYSKHFGMCFTSGDKSFMLRSMFPDPKVLDLKEFTEYNK